jgi:hypothetical protein
MKLTGPHRLLRSLPCCRSAAGCAGTSAAVVRSTGSSGLAPQLIDKTLDGLTIMTSGTPERVREHWRNSGTAPRAGTTAQDIAAFESTHRLALPPSVANFYATVNGMQPDATDEELFVAFPLQEVKPVPESVGGYRGTPDYGPIVHLLPNANDYFVFGECMLWSQVLAVRLRSASETETLWISGSTFVVVAPTFEDFWEIYLRAPVEVLYATSKLRESAV